MNWIKKIFNFYYEGFKGLTWGRSLWLLILIKLFLVFFIMKLFFFSDNSVQKFKTKEDQSLHILENLTK